MTYHKNTYEGVENAISLIFSENKYADKTIERILKSNPKWGSRDRKFIAETTYEMVRWWRLLNFLVDNTESKKNSFHDLFAAHSWKNKQALPDWNVFKNVNFKTFEQNFVLARENRAIANAFPNWLDELCFSQLAEVWNTEISALNEQAQVVLRANTLKTKKETLQKSLKSKLIDTQAVKGFDEALVLEKRQNVFATEEFKNGLFEVQDASSQLVAPYLQIEPGMRVTDACAGAGGKSLHIAAMLENKGKIISLDIEQWKLDELMKRSKRAGATIIETRLIDGSKTIKRLENSSDRLLIDAPCSGLGVLKRNPDAKWKLSQAQIDNINNTQKEILANYCKIVKQGGLMVYATCSILPSENQNQVKLFMNSHSSEFEWLDEKIILPSSGFDGFYMSLIRRK